MIIFDPHSTDLRSGEHLAVLSLGEYQFMLFNEEENSLDPSLDLGRAGPCATILPFPIRDMGDLVKRYEDIRSVLAGMPPTGTLTGRDGQRYRYSFDGTDPSTTPTSP